MKTGRAQLHLPKPVVNSDMLITYKLVGTVQDYADL